MHQPGYPPVAPMEPKPGSSPTTERGLRITLAITAAALFVAVVLLTVLQINARAAIADVDGQIAGVERKLADANERVKDDRSATKALESRHRSLYETNTSLRACTAPARTAIAAGRTGDYTRTASALIDMSTNCGEVGQS